LIALRVSIDVGSIRRALNVGVARSVDGDMRDALTRAARRVAEDAKENHVFRNRTGKLEKSIKGKRATGSFTRGTLTAEVIADTEYAIYVENRVTYRSWAYLRPALRRMQGEIAAIMNDGITRAVRRLNA